MAPSSPRQQQVRKGLQAGTASRARPDILIVRPRTLPVQIIGQGAIALDEARRIVGVAIPEVGPTVAVVDQGGARHAAPDRALVDRPQVTVGLDNGAAAVAAVGILF